MCVTSYWQVDVGPWLPQFVNPPDEETWRAYSHARSFRQPIDKEFNEAMYKKEELEPTNEERPPKT